jgi:hypothetical protein
MAELNVKVGDKLILHGSSKHVVTVTRVTPTGRIRIDKSGSQFDKYGWEMAGSDVWHHRLFLSEPTENEIQEIKETKTKNKALHLMREMKQSDLDYAQAVKIIEILESEEE